MIKRNDISFMTSKRRRSFLREAAGVVGGAAVLGQTVTADTEDVTIKRNVTYRTTPFGELNADLYLPEDETRGTLVWVHGGFWARGDKSRLDRRAMKKAEQGFASVNINYTLSGTAPFPAAPTDVAGAVSWTREHADEYGFNTDLVGLVGRSAGAHLASLAGAAPTVFMPDDATAVPVVDTVIGFYGIYDLRVFAKREETKAVKQFMGGTFEERPAAYFRASPASYLGDATPSHLLLHGTEDQIIPYKASALFADQLANAGVEHELFTAGGAGHGFDKESRWYGRTIGETTSWLDSQ
jgi:acetyl esterase/lipase